MFLYFLSLGEGRGLVGCIQTDWEQHNWPKGFCHRASAAESAAICRSHVNSQRCRPERRADPGPPSEIHQVLKQIWSGGFDPLFSSLDLWASAVSKKAHPPPRATRPNVQVTPQVPSQTTYCTQPAGFRPGRSLSNSRTSCRLTPRQSLFVVSHIWTLSVFSFHITCSLFHTNLSSRYLDMNMSAESRKFSVVSFSFPPAHERYPSRLPPVVSQLLWTENWILLADPQHKVATQNGAQKRNVKAISGHFHYCLYNEGLVVMQDDNIYAVL